MKGQHTLTSALDDILTDKIPTCTCGGYVKPDIVFFGESLPERFFKLRKEDFSKCDLLIVMGTSLTVQPFASLVDQVNEDCVRLLINREEVGTSSPKNALMNMLMGRPFGSSGFKFNHASNTRDVKWLGDIQVGIQELAMLLDWDEELNQLAGQ